jgi:hypothetical protein
LEGHIIHIDHFGNLITDIEEEDLSPERIVIEVAGRCIKGLSHSYTEGSELLAYIGSSGRLEVAMRNGNAARMLHVGIGDEVASHSSS